MVEGLIKDLKERSDRFEQWLFCNVNDEKAVKAATEFFKFQEDSFKTIIKLAQIDLAAVSEIDLQNTSLNALVRKYNIDKPFNSSKAKENFKSGLEMIITDKLSYNGVYFSNGKRKVWINGC